MRKEAPCWLGADPGGVDSFGVAILFHDGHIQTHTVSSTSEAVEFFLDSECSPTAIGIDAPLWWSAGPGGGRRADEWIRRTYRINSGTVQSVNSLRGAALAQGAMTIERLRRFLPHLGVTESHPKALLKAFGYDDYRLLFEHWDVKTSTQNEHERDAAISAVCAKQGFTGRWSRDLASERGIHEQDTNNYWLAPVHYYWPDGPTSLRE